MKIFNKIKSNILLYDFFFIGITVLINFLLYLVNIRLRLWVIVLLFLISIIGFIVGIIKGSDLPATCCSTFDKTTFLCFCNPNIGSIVSCFKFGCKVTANTCDSKALNWISIWKHFYRGFIGCVSNFKGNLGSSSFFHVEADAVRVIGINIRFHAFKKRF